MKKIDQIKTEARERCQNLSGEEKKEKRPVEGIKIFLNKKKMKGISMNVNAIKTFLKIKNKG